MKRGSVNTRNRVFVVGLDGGTLSVLRPLIDEGKLPTVGTLLKGGSWGQLLSTIPPLTAPAWASFITGKNPGKHGVFQFGPVDRSLYQGRRTRVVNSRNLSGEALWDIIGRARKTVGIMNVPLTYPPCAVKGFMVSGMLTPREADSFTYPPQLASSLGQYKIDISVGEDKYGVLAHLNTADSEVLHGLLEQLNALVKMRTEAAMRLLKRYSPDFFMVLFTETDRLQHIFWPYLPANPQRFDNLKNGKLARAVESFFIHLDHNLGKLLEASGTDSIKILMSDHGFGPATEKNVNFNIWLREMGLLRLLKTKQGTLNPKRLLRRLGFSKELLYSSASTLFPGNVVRRLGKTMGKMVSTPIDWDGTKAVFIPIFEFVGGIEILTDGDAPSARYEDLRNDLMQRLLDVKDPNGNVSIVSAAFRREEIYWGSHTQEAPDIIFIMRPQYRGDKGLLSKSIVVQKPKNLSLWTGTHRREGMVLFNGPHIRPGELVSMPRIQDLMPTVLYLLGISIPSDIDGKVIEEAIDPSYLAQHEITYTRPQLAVTGNSGTEEAGYTQEEMDKVRQQLEGLGYLS